MHNPVEGHISEWMNGGMKEDLDAYRRPVPLGALRNFLPVEVR